MFNKSNKVIKRITKNSLFLILSQKIQEILRQQGWKLKLVISNWKLIYNLENNLKLNFSNNKLFINDIFYLDYIFKNGIKKVVSF